MNINKQQTAHATNESFKRILIRICVRQDIEYLCKRCYNFKIYQITMKGNILVALLFIALAVCTHAEPTVLTYIVEREINQEDHYIELTLKIQVDGYSLKKSIDTAAAVINSIKEAAIADCQANAVDKQAKKQCKDIVDASKYEVEPKYHMVRKVPTFTLFILTHEVTIKIKNIKGLGKIIDQIQDIGQDVATLQQFVWKTDEEVDAEVSTLKDGLAEGHELCNKVGKELVEVISVEELQQEEKEQQEEVDEDMVAQEVETIIFKFKVKCGEKKGKYGKKK